MTLFSVSKTGLMMIKKNLSSFNVETKVSWMKKKFSGDQGRRDSIILKI